MDIHDRYLLEIIAMTAAPFFFAVVATAAVWRSINRRALFLVFAALSLWGLSSIIYPIALSLLNPLVAGPATYPSAQFNVLLATATLVALFDFPLLCWLRSALRRT